MSGFFRQCDVILRCKFSLCQHLLPVIGDTNWHCLDLDSSAAVLHQHVGPVHPAAQTSLTTVQEVETIVISVECHHVTTQHTLQYLI